MRLLDLADVARKSGLRVVEVPGWQTRGTEMAAGSPGTIVAHHTATSRLAAGDLPTLGILKSGRSDLTGPLCNLALGRSGTVYVVAAGRANHAGRTFKLRQSNSHSLGIEAEHDGVSPWPAEQYAAYVALCATLRDAYGAAPVEGHKEIAAPLGRKTDPNFGMGGFRADVARATTAAALRAAGRVATVLPGKVDPTPPPLLAADGRWGELTCDAVEWYLGIARNGALDVETSSAIQRWVGRPQTGALLRDDMRAVQRKLGVEATGKWTTATVLAWQNFLNRRIREAAAQVTGPFLLPSGHWYGQNDKTSRSHSGYQAVDKPAIRQIQTEVAVSVDGVFGPGTEAAVKAWQAGAALPTSGRVDAATWAAMAKV